MSKNDDKILSIKQSIAKKRESMGKKPRFIPITNCSIDFRGTRYNLNVMNHITQLAGLASEIKSLEMSASELGLLEYAVISGYNVSEWIQDILQKINVIKYAERERELDALEKQLNDLLSDDKQTELRIEALSKAFENI